jgi:tRNA(Ile2)-agmatinylcytidine synthase
MKGDKVRVGGGIRKSSSKHARTLNVEFFEVLNLQKKTVLVNPRCESCNKRMKSKGRNQGFECVKCGQKSPHKITIQVPRQIKTQMYLPLPSAHRHLTRPQQRTGVINRHRIFDDKALWFDSYKN